MAVAQGGCSAIPMRERGISAVYPTAAEQQPEQPDAFGGLGVDSFSSGGGNGSEHDSWGGRHADEPTGLTASRRLKCLR